jgi:SHS2 domain-containing protein
MGRPRFRQLPHTADVRLSVYGENEEQLLRNLALGITHLVLGRLPRARPRVQAQVSLPQQTLASRLVRVGNEVVYWLFTRRHAPVDLHLAPEGALLELAPLPPKAQLLFEIKAVTFHALRPQAARDRLRAVLTLDL